LSKFLSCYGEEWVSSKFNECSGFFPWIFNPGVVSFDRGLLYVLTPLKVDIQVSVASMVALFTGKLWLRVFEPRLFLGGMDHLGQLFFL
jgi:hypothetical protein